MSDSAAALESEFDPERAWAHVEELASRAMGGRLPGSEGERRAAAYIVRALEAAGAEPLPGDAGFEDPFDAVVPALEATPTLEIGTGGDARAFEHLLDFSVNVQGAAAGGTVEGETVWLGELDPEREVGNVAGKVVVCSAVRIGPKADLGDGLVQYLARLRRAAQAGAAGLLQLSGRVDRRKVMNHQRERPGLPSLDVSRRVVEALFGGTMPSEVGQAGTQVALDVPLQDRAVTSAGNLVGRIGSGELRVLLCAHYDHVGALPDGRWFPGAGDNASGVGVVLEAVRVLSRRVGSANAAVAVVLTSGEELGMVGADRFARKHADWLRCAVTVVNVDEVSGAAGDPLRVLLSPAFPAGVLTRDDEARVGASLSFGVLAAGGFADHEAFLRVGVARVATLFAPTRRADVVHTVRDTPSGVAPGRLQAAGRALLLLASRAARA